LSKLPDKDPWSDVIETGGVDEWIWKGKAKQAAANGIKPSIQIRFQAERSEDIRSYEIKIEKHAATYTFHVFSESITEYPLPTPPRGNYLNRPFNSADAAFIYEGKSPNSKIENLDVRLSILSQIFGQSYQRALADLPQKLSKIALYRDWVFGRHSTIRNPQRVGLDSYGLAGDSSNLAQVLKALRDRGDSVVFERLLDLMRKFYEPVKDVDTELVGTHLRIMIKEEGLSSRTPAERLSDGTLRWLMLLIILLDPTPPPVICIDEPELGLHPDAIHTLADLLIDASTRTQLIVTTHSDALLDAFTETPEAVCVCEKVEGSTVIQRLDKDRLKSWLEDYSLGQLWAKGEIGGNRW
jgi:predicted ATPase